MILCMTPWDNGGNLGLAYNRAMELLGPNDWAIFKDHDCLPTTDLWHRQFQEAIRAKPYAGAIVAMTNRIARSWQRCGDDSNDIVAHRAFGFERAKIRTLLDISETHGWGGVLFAISKAAWQEVGGFASGLGCVDHSVHFAFQRIGRKCWLHEGIYAYHFRHQGGTDPTTLFPKAADCPCQTRPRITPTERFALP